MINFPSFAKYGQGKKPAPGRFIFLKRGLNWAKRNENILTGS